jgi:hypothetical protein
MAGIDIPTAEAKLALWLAAEEKVAAGQSVAADGRVLTRANLAEIADRIDYWNGHVQRLTRGGRTLTRVTTRA